jgi:hypothetical protein
MAKVDLFPDFRAFLLSLNNHAVEYLLLGGYAVAHYGYERVTKDIDVWIAVNRENATRLSSALQEFGGFSAAAVEPEMFLAPGKVFMLGREPVRIDILTGPSGVEFTDCYGRRNVVRMDGVEVPLISLADLRANKLASGRPKDLADLQRLPTDPSPPPHPKKPAKRRRRPK